MTNDEVFSTVSEQMMAEEAVEVEGKRYPVNRSSAQKLRMVTFNAGEKEFTAIEQNPEKPSRWGKLARDGHKVVQIKDVKSNRFVAVSVDGKVKGYGR